MSRTPGETHPTLVNSFSPDFHSLSSDFTEPTIPAHLAHLGKHTHTTLGHSLSPDEYWIHEYLVVKTRATSTAGTERVKHTFTRTSSNNDNDKFAKRPTLQKTPRIYSEQYDRMQTGKDDKSHQSDKERNSDKCKDVGEGHQRIICTHGQTAAFWTLFWPKAKHGVDANCL